MSDSFDWLIVAPRHNDLRSVDSEIAAIAAHHNIIPQPPLIGYVSDLDVSRAVNEVECDIFHWLTHSDGDELLLSDGLAVDADTLAQFCLSCQAELCIIDACVGQQMAERVAYLCACDVIYIPVQIEDKVAALYMSQYATALAEVGDYYEAYQAAGSHGGQYKFIRAKDSVTRGRNDNAASIAELRTEQNQVKFSITMLSISCLMIILIALALTLWQMTVLSDIRAQLSDVKAELHYIQRTINDRSGR